MSRAIRVLHFAENYLPRLGGAEVATHQLVRAQRRLGADARVLAPTWKARRGMRFDYPVYQFPKSRLSSNALWAFAALSSVYLRWRFDILHVTTALPHADWAVDWLRRAPFAKGVKLAVTATGGDLNVVPEIGYGELIREENLPVARRVLTAADLLSPTSTNMVARMIELLPEAEEKIVLIPRGCDVRRLAGARSRRAEARRRLGLDEGDFVVISVGRTARVKNYELLMRVLASAVRSIPTLRLLAVGDRDPALLAMGEELGVAERILFTGRIPATDADPNELLDLPHERMLDALAASDVGVMTSYIEAYSNATVEQGAAGLPLLITSRNGVRDRVPPEFAWFVIEEPGEEAFVERLVRLHNDAQLRASYSEALLRAFADQSHDHIARLQLDAYRRIMSFE